MIAITVIGYISVDENSMIPNSKKIQATIKEEVLKLWDEKDELCLVTGLARGTDQLFCEIGIKLRKEYKKKANVKIVAIIPYEKQAFLWPQTAQTAYNALIKQVDEVECLAERSFNLGLTKKRTLKMIDYADHVIFTEYGNNVDSYKEYAKENNTPYTILKLDPFIAKKKDEDEDNGKKN